ncbi:MAG: hypothetical protein J0M20_01130 [Burkholderiales bacterium]|nr:hypothetical protein [Burkholderiales bacterium]
MLSLGIVPALQQFVPEIMAKGAGNSLPRILRRFNLIRLTLTVLFGGLLAWSWTTSYAWFGFPADYARASLFGLLAAGLALLSEYTIYVLEAMLLQRIAQPLRALLPVGRLLGLSVLWAAEAVDFETMMALEIALHSLTWLAATVMLRRQLGVVSGDAPCPVSDSQLTSFVLDMSWAQLLAMGANAGLIRVAAGHVLGLEASAIFSFMQQLTIQATRLLPSTQFANLIRPMLVAKFQAGQHEIVAAAFGLLLKVNAIVTVPMLLIGLLGGDRLLTLLVGRSAEAGGLGLALVALVPAMTAVENIGSTALQVARQSVVVRRLGWLSLFVGPAVYLGARFGPAGAMGGLLASVSLVASATLMSARRWGRCIHADVRGLARILLAGLFAGLTALASGLVLPWEALAGVGCIAFLGWLLLLGSWLSETEARAIREFSGKHLPMLDRWTKKNAA